MSLVVGLFDQKVLRVYSFSVKLPQSHGDTELNQDLEKYNVQGKRVYLHFFPLVLRASVAEHE